MTFDWLAAWTCLDSLKEFCSCSVVVLFFRQGLSVQPWLVWNSQRLPAFLQCWEYRRADVHHHSSLSRSLLLACVSLLSCRVLGAPDTGVLSLCPPDEELSELPFSCSCLLSGVLVFLGPVCAGFDSMSIWPDGQIAKRLFLRAFLYRGDLMALEGATMEVSCLWDVPTESCFSRFFTQLFSKLQRAESRGVSTLSVVSPLWSKTQSEFGSCLADSFPTPSWLFIL